MKKSIRLFFVILFCLSMIPACTYLAPNKAKVEAKIAERGRELNDGALEATRAAEKSLAITKAALDTAVSNQAGAMELTKPAHGTATNSVKQATKAVELAESYLTRHESLDGKPIESQVEVVKALLDENSAMFASAQASERARLAQEERWRAKEQAYEQKLLDYGTKYEQERNEKITRWIKWGSIIFGVIAVPIALMVLFPPLASGLVGLFPSLMGIFGMPLKIGTKMVRAIGDARQELKTQIEYEKSRPEIKPKTYTAEEVKAMLDENLKYHIKEASEIGIIDRMRENNNVL